MQLPHERIRELAVHVGHTRAQRALQLTLPADVTHAIQDCDDLKFLAYTDRKEIAREVANLVRKGQATVVFPSEFLGKGDGEPVQVDDEQEA